MELVENRMVYDLASDSYMNESSQKFADDLIVFFIERVLGKRYSFKMDRNNALKTFVNKSALQTFEEDSQMLECNLNDLQTIFGKISTFKYESKNCEMFCEDLINFALILGEVYNEFYEGCEIDVNQKDCEILACYIAENLAWESETKDSLIAELKHNF